MNIHKLLPAAFKWFLISVFLLVVLGACGNNARSQPEGTPRPTTPAALRKISPPPYFPKESANSEITDNIQGGIYTHPSGAFSFKYPTGWLEDTSEYGSVFISEPDGEGVLYITATDTGRPLNGSQFEIFVQAREDNFFAKFEGYTQSAFEVDPLTRRALTLKSVLFRDLPETVKSYYFLEQQVVYAIDMWWESDKSADYEIIYNEVLESFTSEPGKVPGELYYNFVITFYDSLNAFSFTAPVCWQYDSRVEDGIIIDSFSAPDEGAYLEHIMFSMPERLTESEVEQKIFQAAFGSFLIEPKWVEVESRNVDENGWVSIQWKDDGSGWKKESKYCIQGAKVLALNGVIRSGDENIFQSTIDYAFDEYSIPGK
ncbi:MAG: hypothetical protein BGO78_06635 [Chloroflexi bacterium 44-23]|nr:MAG: hypothetical protein BGO78_06635 [Chloroflexi bacterium 44-23]